MTFVADVHLGKLARLLRLLGFEVYWRNDLDDPEIAAMSAQLGRTVLTRDRGLLKRKAVVSGLLIASSDPTEQLIQVISAFDLVREIRPFTRCSACGEALAAVSPEAAAPLIPASVRGKYDRYFVCASCGKAFWKGDHFRTMGPLLARLETELGLGIDRR
jgi:uncharacterized protein with PIN domain